MTFRCGRLLMQVEPMQLWQLRTIVLHQTIWGPLVDGQRISWCKAMIVVCQLRECWWLHLSMHKSQNHSSLRMIYLVFTPEIHSGLIHTDFNGLSIDPPPELPTVIFLWVKNEQRALAERCRTTGHAAKDSALSFFLNLLIRLWHILLQDMAVLSTFSQLCSIQYPPVSAVCIEFLSYH